MGMRDCWLRGAAIRPCSLFFPTPVGNHSDIEEWSLALILLHSTSAAIPSFYRATELGRGSFFVWGRFDSRWFPLLDGMLRCEASPGQGTWIGRPEPHDLLRGLAQSSLRYSSSCLSVGVAQVLKTT